MKTRFTLGALRAAKDCQTHIKGQNYQYNPEEAAEHIDQTLRLPELVRLIETIVEEAKRDLASSPDWQGTTVRINRSRLKELNAILNDLR